MSGTATASLLRAAQQRAEAQEVVDEDGELEGGRVAYFMGECQQSASALNEVLVDMMGIAPAIIAAQQPSHADLPLSEVCRQLRATHAEYWELYKPVQVLSPPPCGLEGVRVVLNALLDAGDVPAMSGGMRADASGVVVLDGLCTDSERGAILAWMTSPDHDHTGDPPAGRWERACVDREGDNATWGLQQEMLTALEDNPPPAIVAVQSRLAALYPEYTLSHMPAEHMTPPRRPKLCRGVTNDEGTDAGDVKEEQEEEEEEEEDGDAQPLSCFVGNAVMPADPCAWHLDADPASLPPYSPWIHNYGYYTNREPGRPLFVSLLLYLNDVWPDDSHAETLFLDPESQCGIFVRPAPGRVVLMEQDVAHRISTPSSVARGPRYSLVWKMVLFPRRHASPEQVTPTSRPASSVGEDTAKAGPAQLDGTSTGPPLSSGHLGRGMALPLDGPLSGAEPRTVSGEAWTGQLPHQSICRSEWGQPMRVGSASQHAGIAAWRAPVST